MMSGERSEPTEAEREWLRSVNFDPTDAVVCVCGHEGLPRVWHLWTCPLWIGNP